MAASDLIAAAIAAFFVTQPIEPQQFADGVASAPCSLAVPGLRAFDPSPGADRASRARLAPPGCSAPRSVITLALDAVRAWAVERQAMASLARLARPRPVVSVAPLPDPADDDPIARMVRLAADEFRERDPGVELDRKQLACLQRALYFEARGEGSLGQAAVAHVALNRVGTRPSRATICEVVREPGQFAPYLNGEPDEADLAQTDEDATRSAIETAAMVMAGYVPDPSRGGQYFYAPRILKTQPAWAKGLKETARIGGHRFFADPEALAPAPTRLARN